VGQDIVEGKRASSASAGSRIGDCICAMYLIPWRPSCMRLESCLDGTQDGYTQRRNLVMGTSRPTQTSPYH